MPDQQQIKTFLSEVTKKQLVAGQPTQFTTQYHRLILIRRLTETIVIILLMLGGQQFLIQNTFLSALWPTTGVALSALFLRGNTMLLGIFLGNLAGYLYFHIPFLVGVILSLLFSGYIFLIRFLALKTIGSITPLASLSVLLRFVALVAILSAVHISLLLKIWMMVFPFTATFFSGFVGWLGQINGILCLTPLCLIFDPFVPQRFFHLKAWPWWGSALLLIGCHLLYFLVFKNPTLPFAIVSFLALACYARCFGQIPTCLVLLGVSVLYLSLILVPTQGLLAAPGNTEVILLLFTLTAITSLGISTYTRTSLNLG